MNLKNMNGDYKIQNLFQSMKINSLTNSSNNFNDIQCISMDLKNNNNINNNNFINLKNQNQNNGQPSNLLNTSENELFNFELDQSTESIMTNQSITQQQIPFDFSLKNNNINNIKNIDNRNSSGALKSNNKNINLDFNNNETMISLEEKLKQENKNV